ncbi:hypothetical protein Q4Q35_09020 [Flavivirga aquimarina]|uniref:Lipoprotein n=1 Tax=Flavivirga aquimarina TaxID=2027862 RepID=A0ABT8WA02_9FLAO|nr:hypothetical protein [Flavivirga aquimarina]MDO5969950.1 hypothetical protein [Flavivirga aquimarina]
MKNSLVILVVTLLFACGKSNEMEEQYNLDVGLEFSVLNSQNEDILNPENPNHLDVANIKLLYVINGEKQEVYNPNLDNPRNFMIYKHENEYRIKITLNHSETSGKSITYIQWNDSDVDTIEVNINRTQNSILQDEIWLNGKQVWQRGDNTIDPYFVLRK